MGFANRPTVRVFVSSVMEGFKDYREAARQGIIAAGGEPVMAEDFGALPVSSRNACLDAVKSSDLFLLIIGSRGGWTAPSGKLVVEEEFEEARKNHIPVFTFLQDVKRDSEADALANRISDYVEGVFRPSYTTPLGLSAEVQKALTPHIQQHNIPTTGVVMIQNLVSSPGNLHEEAVLRFAIGPDRIEEVIDPVDLGSPDLERLLMELAHRADVGLFSYNWGKTSRITPSEIIIVQGEEASIRDGLDYVALSLNSSGYLVFDTNVTNRPHPNPRGEWQFDSLIVVEIEIETALRRCLAFSKAFWEIRDKYRRYDRMGWNTSLGNLGHRNLVKEYPHGNSISVPMFQHDGPIVAFDSPRIINRIDLLDIEKHIYDALSLIRRRFNEKTQW